MKEAIGNGEYEVLDVRKDDTKDSDEEKILPKEFLKGTPNLTLNIDRAVASSTES